MIHIFRILLVFFLLTSMGRSAAYAQGGWRIGVAQEIGVVAGPLAFFSDYGIRYNLDTDTGNTGMGIGIVHYINFAFAADCNCYTMDSYFNDHFRIRSELDFHQTKLNHFGEVASKDNLGGRQLRGMIGNSQVFEIGAHLEYFPLSIRDYTAFAYPISPFVSLGANFVHFDPHAYSTLGPLEDNLFHTFEGGMDLESGTTWSIVLGGGMRYKLGTSSDLVMNLQWRYYDTDFLDGLDHDNPQNKFNDIIFWLNFGYIYYLNF